MAGLPLMTDKLLALARRDLLTAARYRSGLVFQSISVLGEVAGLFFLARAVGPGFRPDGMDFFPFLLIGSTFYVCLVGGVQVFVETVRTAQLTGTLETLLSTSTHDVVTILLMAASSFVSRAVQLVIALAAACLLFGLRLNTSHAIAVVLSFVLSIAVIAGVGLLAAALQIWAGRGSSMVWLFASAGALISGAFFPVSALPQAVRQLSWLFPVTHSLDAMRIALVSGSSMAGFQSHLLWLTAYAILLVPFSLLVLARVLRQARHDGTLAVY
jgi:ABC-2 type transport system permease protein